MKMKLVEVQMRANNLAEIVEKKLPYNLMRGIKNNLLRFQQELCLIEEERVKTIKKYAKKDENGEWVIKDGRYTFDEGEEEKYNKEFNELLQNEIDVDVQTVPEDIVEQTEKERYDALTTLDLIKIDFMIEKQEEKVDGK